jgi:hypothetical protein
MDRQLKQTASCLYSGGNSSRLFRHLWVHYGTPGRDVLRRVDIGPALPPSPERDGFSPRSA